MNDQKNPAINMDPSLKQIAEWVKDTLAQLGGFALKSNKRRRMGREHTLQGYCGIREQRRALIPKSLKNYFQMKGYPIPNGITSKDLRIYDRARAPKKVGDIVEVVQKKFVERFVGEDL